MYNNGKVLSSSSASVSASDQQQRRHHDDDNDETAAASALIDSYFLPGGILDPEESGQGQGQGQPQSKVIKSEPQPQSQPPNQHHNATADAMRSRLDRAIGGSQYQMMGNEGTMATGDVFDGGVNTTSGGGNDYNSRVGVGVRALDPSSDDVVGGMPIFGMASRNSHQVHQQRGGSASLNTGNVGGGGLSMTNSQDGNGMSNHMNMNNMNVGMGGVNMSRMNMDMGVGGYPQTSGGLSGINQHHAQHHNQHHPHNNSVHSQMGSFGFNSNSIQNQQQSVPAQPTSRNLTSASSWFVESPAAHVNMNGYSQQQDEISNLLGALHQQSQQQPNALAHTSRDVQNAPIGSGKGSGMQMSMGREGHLSTYSSSNESQSRATSVAATHLHHNANPWGNANSNSNSNESLSKKVESSNSLQFAPANVAGGNVTMTTPGAQVSNHHIVHNNSSSLSLSNTFPHESNQSSGAAGANLSSAAAATTNTGILSKSSGKSLAIGSALHPHQVSIATKAQSAVLPQSVRPPPGFSSSSSRVNAPTTDPSSGSAGQAQQIPLVSHATANATSPSSIDQHNQAQMMPSIHNSTRYSSGIMNHGNDAAAVAEEQERQLHHHHLSAHAHANYRNKKYAQHLHNDGDYDLASLNSKSSRDVPSTIYVRSGSNTDEEDLTACADSITVASLPISKVENEPMDVVEETSARIPSEVSLFELDSKS